MFDPSANLLASVCDNLSCLGLQGCRLLYWFSDCLLDALTHGPEVAGVRGLLNVLGQLQPVVVCAAACCFLFAEPCCVQLSLPEDCVDWGYACS